MILFIMIYVQLIQVKMELIYFYQIEKKIYILQHKMLPYAKQVVNWNHIIQPQKKLNVIAMFHLIMVLQHLK